MDILVRTTPHESQRYPTVGDWQFPDDHSVMTVTVSEMNNEDYEFLVGIHEQIEAYLCHKRGISDEIVTAFDKVYEERRAKGVIQYQGEPGDHPRAPYKKEHFFATTVERLIAAELGVDWGKYDAKVSSL